MQSNLFMAPPRFLPKLILWVAAVVTAMILGFVTYTANLVLIGLVVGTVAGVFLLTIPKKIIWLICALGLATPALLDLAGHGFSRGLWAVSMMAMLLWVPAILTLFNINKNIDRRLPLFVYVLLFLVIYAIVASILQFHGMGELTGGFKRYFQTVGLTIALATMALDRQHFDKWLKLLFVIALMQLPFALFERLVLVPLRGGIDLVGGQATDVVAGTMGANLDSGSPNGVMVIFVLTAFAFVFARWKHKLIETKAMIWCSIALLLPLALGETKVVIVMLPLMAFVLLRKGAKKNPSQFILGMLLLLALTTMLAYLYLEMLDKSGDMQKALEGVFEYNAAKVGYGAMLLNRFTALTFWWNLHGWDDPIRFLFGHGLGSAYGSGADAGHAAQIYLGYGIGITTITSILWDLGLIGLLLYFLIWTLAWFALEKVWANTKNPQVKADCLALQVAVAFTLLFTMYLDSQINLIVHEIIISFILGYTAFLYREQFENQHSFQPNETYPVSGQRTMANAPR